jgi:hypothetical protein
MANEREPDDPLPDDYMPDGAVATHHVTDGENWASVAAQYNVSSARRKNALGKPVVDALMPPGANDED